MRRAGLALVLAVGALGVLAVLGSAFVVLARLERHAARQRLLGTQALLLARSGVEDALARVGAGQDPTEPWSQYRGEDWNDDGAVTGLEAASEAFRPGTRNLADCPVRFAMAPSFFKRHGSDLDAKGLPAPDRILVDGLERGCSGGFASGTYALKVEDESAKINVNGGFLDSGNRDADADPDHRDLEVRLTTALSDTGLGWNGQLVQVLGHLAGQLGVSPTLGTDVVSGRPEGGYRSLEAVQALAGWTTDLSPYLTVASWVDRKVVRPQSWRSEVLPMWRWCPSDYKDHRAPLALEQGGRPPVNLNAALRPVVYALLAGVKGRCSQTPNPPSTIPALTELWSPTVVSTIATRMVNWRKPSPPRTWAEFSIACDSSMCGPGPGIWYGIRHSDLLKANFNPNTQSNKELPDHLKYLWVDKTDLFSWSTEGCLRPTGVFRISSVGRVRGASGRLLAEAGASATVQAFDLLRQTSQKDFAGGRTSLHDGVGDGFLSLAGPPAMPTYRAIGAAAGTSWWGGPSHPEGLGMMTYPCPPPAVANGVATDLDGYLALATLEEAPGNPPSGTLFFHAGFDDALAADFGGAPSLLDQTLAVGTNLDRGDDAELQTDISSDVWPSLPGGRPNGLYPDGCHAQSRRSPAYEAVGNLPPFQNSGNRAVVMYWVKHCLGTNWDIAVKCQTDFSVARIPTLSPAGFERSQAFGIGRCQRNPQFSAPTSAQMGILVESRRNGIDVPPCNDEQHFRIRELDSAYGSSLAPGMRWNLAVGWMDTNETAAGWGANLRWLRADYTTSQMWTETVSGSYVPLVTAGNEDLLSPDAALSLGAPGPREKRLSGDEGQLFRGWANQVIDEVSVYDFGDDWVAAYNNGMAWALQRFRDGRYYKGNDASFTSTDVLPDSGRPVRLLAVQWTAFLPREPHRDWREGNNQYGAIRPTDPYLGQAAVDVELRLGAPGAVTAVPLAEGKPVGLAASSFRYRARIRPNLSDAASQPVLETPVLDDITFVYQRKGGPRVLSWAR